MVYRIIILFLSVSALFTGSVFALKQFKEPIFSLSPKQDLQDFEIINDEEEPKKLTKEVLLSTPLIIFGRGNATPFTPSAVIDETNRQRSIYGVPVLKENSLLNSAAEIKVRDIFEKQYFDHVSPVGHGPDALAKIVGYEYVSIGENLAMGSFGDEGSLVEAWMQSQGHRENILRNQFQEIGLAVGRGVYNGQQVLIAVQEFGRPLSSCPFVDSSLKKEIDQKKVELTTLSSTLETVRSDIDDVNASSSLENIQKYQDKVNLYNSQVTQYNSLVSYIKDKTSVYNGQVRNFNNCLRISL
jgi:hypothetical protein